MSYMFEEKISPKIRVGCLSVVILFYTNIKFKQGSLDSSPSSSEFLKFHLTMLSTGIGCYAICEKTNPSHTHWNRVYQFPIDNNEANYQIIMSPGTAAFISWNPGVLFIAMSWAQRCSGDPDFAESLINQDRLCHIATCQQQQQQQQ